jgi:uncharacterized protein (UPF0333 family)
MARLKLLNSKGQNSFETILVTLLIISIASFVLWHFLSLSDSTTALIILKDDAIKKFYSLNENYSILRIEFYESENQISFNILTEPNSLSTDQIDFSDTISKIINVTKYSSVSITINE